MPRYESKVMTPQGVKYVYSEEALFKRHRRKARRYRRIRKSAEQIRHDILNDAKAGLPEALAAAVVAVTYERPGNTQSAANGHLGVTGWRRENFADHGSYLSVRYVGKSGVKQSKIIRNSLIVGLLRPLIEQATDRPVLGVSASRLNQYLRQYGITAKDLRGFGANEEMKVTLRSLRTEGTPLRRLSERQRRYTLKREWLRALAIVADKLGHSKAILRKQYLVPGFEERYINS